MNGLALPRRDWALIGSGAVLLCLAYPPFSLFVPSFLCLVPAIWLLHASRGDPRPLRRRTVQGFWFGLISNGVVLYWLVSALWHFTPLAGLGYALTMIILGLYGALLFGLTNWIVGRTKLSVVVVFPILWTAVEWAVGHQGDIRFPWLGLGTSLTGFPTVVQLADVIGARGITFLLALANAALAVAWLERGNRPRAIRLGAGVLVGLVLAVAYGVVRERTIEMHPVGTVAVLQPDIASAEKWDRGRLDSIARSQLDLAERAMHDASPDLVVWPEAALPIAFSAGWVWPSLVGNLSRAYATPQFVGGFHEEHPSPDVTETFNAAFLFDSLGRWQRYAPYDKRYLVPVTERVPFLPPTWFNKVAYFNGLTPGRASPVFDVRIGRFGALICYESAFEDLSRQYRREGADFLLNITNDAWFGRTSAPYQHAAHLVMRAIENRVGIARAANTGVSEFVDPLGRTYDRTPLYTMTFRADTVWTTTDRTVYTRLGDWVGFTVLVLSGALVAFAWSRR